jgi:hypothetical protein
MILGLCSKEIEIYTSLIEVLNALKNEEEETSDGEEVLNSCKDNPCVLLLKVFLPTDEIPEGLKVRY